MMEVLRVGLTSPQNLETVSDSVGVTALIKHAIPFGIGSHSLEFIK